MNERQSGGEKRGISNRARKLVVRKQTDLEVYQRAFEAVMQLFELSKRFPAEERYALTDQMRRASRSVCANLAECWRKRRYPAAFISKLGDAEGEAAETQTWIQFSVSCGYVSAAEARPLYAEYDEILGQLVTMITNSEKWTLPTRK
jgi:four helix bundle protein